MENIIEYELEKLNGISKNLKQIYKKLGVSNALSLIYFFPKSYINYNNNINIRDCDNAENVVVKAKIIKKSLGFSSKKRIRIYNILAVDPQNKEFNITIFNSKYNYDLLQENQTFLIEGRLKKDWYRPNLIFKSFVSDTAKEKIIPVYKLSAGLTQNIVRNNIKQILHLIEGIIEPLPDYIIKKYKLMKKKEALSNIHFPKSSHDLKRAQERLIFEECLIFQLGLLNLKQRNREKTNFFIKRIDMEPFYKSLKFELTVDQNKAINDCLSDMQRNIPMNRLIQGDVGSGKTIVAASIAYSCYKNNIQVCMMAPTEVLAKQHYNTFVKLFSKFGANISILTGSTTKKQKSIIKSNISAGICDILIGTHAVIQKDINFKNLGLVITDEQHRFGVSQRSMLTSKGNNPHVCVMSATPIPRTLALIIYGDLDISIIKSMPKGRKYIKTYAITPDKRERALNFIKQHIGNNEQAYIVCPLVEQGESDLKNVIEYYESLSKGSFKNYKLGLMHGKLPSAEKEKIMNEFKNKNIDLLISTTVIEVGVDVSNATIILIENVERFGLSQIHQLRGRVGRGVTQAYCILVSEKISDRIKMLCTTNDGFKISEYDLKLRGPGDFFGNKQHGLPEFKITNTLENFDILKETLNLSKEILEKDPKMNNDDLKELKLSIIKMFSDEDICFN